MLAEKRNLQDDPAYTCQHICVDPYQRPWLESTGAQVIRKKIEDVDVKIIEDLQENDILFIDSTHVLRPQGDVVHEYLVLLGLIRPGVIVQVHDIFTPRDYPEKLVLDFRLMWNEQYILEAFLSFNTSFEILSMVNFLAKDHTRELERACPIFAGEVGCNPGSFWFRRRLEA